MIPKIWKLIWPVLSAVAVLTGVLILNDDSRPDSHTYLPLLPLSYFFILFVLRITAANKHIDNVAILLFVAQSFVRFVVSPLFLYLGDYISLFANLTADFELNGILLMIYEQLVCLWAINRALDKYMKPISQVSIRLEKKLSVGYLGSFLFAWAVVMAVLWFSFPTIQSNFTSLFDMITSSEKFKGDNYRENLGSGSVIRMATSFFLVFFRAFRVIFPAYLMYLINKRFKGVFGLLLCLIVMSTQLLFVPDTIANVFIVLLVLFLYATTLYPSYSKPLISTMSVVVSIGLVAVILIIYEVESEWYGLTTPYQYLSELFQSYFTGIDNVSSTYFMPDRNRLEVLWNTLFSSIPFQSAIFGFTAQVDDLNGLYTDLPGLGGQIVSTIGGGRYIFGFVLAPLFSYVFVYNSIRYACLSHSVNNSMERITYIFLAIQIMLGLGVYNIQITLTNWVHAGIPMLLISNYINKHSKS